MGAWLFHRGPARFDVGLVPIPTDLWLFPDDQAGWLEGKNRLLDAPDARMLAVMPDSAPAQGELLALIAPDAAPEGEPAIAAAARRVSDDLVILERADGAWIVTAACLTSPTYFTAAHALGKTLACLHAPVPGGAPGLSGRIARVFDNLRPDLVLERFNWTIQATGRRFTPDGAPLRAIAEAAQDEEAAALLFQRVERQTIRRLPATGGIVFTIRVRLMRLADLLSPPADRAAFAAA